jgi:quinate dehydrogenase (quinone)
MATLSPEKTWHRVVLRLFGAILVIVGLALGYGGIQLLMLGGSAYYAIIGLLLIVSGVLFILKKTAAAWVYAVAFIGTVIWALSESGFQFWPLMPRLVAPSVLALAVFLLAPLLPFSASPRAVRSVSWAGTGIFALGLIVTGVSLFFPHATIYNPEVAANLKGSAPAQEAQKDWQFYGRSPAGTRFAPFDQITKDNVSQLKVAWTFRTGDVADGPQEDQNTPLQVGDTVYACTPNNIVFALNAENGQQRWKFDPDAKAPIWHRCRGLGYYDATVASNNATAPVTLPTADQLCAQRIIMSTIDGRLMAIDAKSGQSCTDFGTNGAVNLKTGIAAGAPGFYIPTSAPTVSRGLIILGGWVWDNRGLGEPSGVIRAFSARTGEVVWAWDLGNPNITKLPPEGQTYTEGTPNMWSTPAFDDKLGLVYLPMGNAPPDYYGGHRRPFDDAYSSSVVALDINTGRERWKFQTVHHDLWDYDVPAQPALYDMPDANGNVTPALVQVTKRGQIFVLNRATGEPIKKVEEKPVPHDGAPGEHVSPTQPYSVDMPVMGNGARPLTEADMWGATPFDQLWCRIEFKSTRYDGEFTPPRPDSISLQNPGNFGGMNWGSAAINEDTGLLVVNDIRLPIRVKLVPHDEQLEKTGNFQGHDLYSPMKGTPYAVRNSPFMSPLGVPCVTPPFGTIAGIDLKSGKVAWQVPAGTVKDLGNGTGVSIPLGMPTLGGPMATRSGLVFFAGTQDFYLRALDQSTGKELWKGALPVGGQATPMTYVSPESGRQFVVISAGGARQSPKRGDYIIAYALPK